jgi:hypothetical protein
VFETGLFPPGVAFQSVGVDRGAWRHIVFEKTEQSLSSKVGNYGQARTSGDVSSAFLYRHQDQCSLPAFQLTAASPAGWGAANPWILNLYFAP